MQNNGGPQEYPTSVRESSDEDEELENNLPLAEKVELMGAQMMKETLNRYRKKFQIAQSRIYRLCDECLELTKNSSNQNLSQLKLKLESEKKRCAEYREYDLEFDKLSIQNACLRSWMKRTHPNSYPDSILVQQESENSQPNLQDLSSEIISENFRSLFRPREDQKEQYANLYGAYLELHSDASALRDQFFKLQEFCSTIFEDMRGNVDLVLQRYQMAVQEMGKTIQTLRVNIRKDKDKISELNNHIGLLKTKISDGDETNETLKNKLTQMCTMYKEQEEYTSTLSDQLNALKWFQDVPEEVQDLNTKFKEVCKNLDAISTAFDETQEAWEKDLRKFTSVQHELQEEKKKSAKLNQSLLELQSPDQRTSELKLEMELTTASLYQQLSAETAKNRSKDSEERTISAAMQENASLREELEKEKHANQEIVATQAALKQIVTEFRSKLPSAMLSEAKRDMTGESVEENSPRSAKKKIRGAEEKERKGLDILMCSVCGEKLRDTALSGCGHVFCKECVEQNISSRNRRCPQCKKHFSSSEVIRVFLT